ncbi:MAG: serine/threonine-protein kinase [Kofleriaceae bacterium]
MTTALEPTLRLPATRTNTYGDYHVLAELARGGTSSVFLGEHRVTKQRVALKVIAPYYSHRAELVRRLLAERNVTDRVRHTGLLDIMLASRNETGTPYLVMDYLEGECLGKVLDRGRLDVDTVIDIGSQIARAVEALHGAGVVHCDIKPDNVFLLAPELDRTRQVKVIDYGVARLCGEEVLDDETISGTPGYMAPEQWRGLPTSKSDVYSLGCLLYELVTGELPFSGGILQVMRAHMQDAPAWPSDRVQIRADLEHLILRAMEKDPILRPTMLELASALTRISRR